MPNMFILINLYTMQLRVLRKFWNMHTLHDGMHFMLFLDIVFDVQVGFG